MSGAATPRRGWLARVAASLVLISGLAACNSTPLAPTGDSDPGHPPIVFVHGNGDSAAQWLTTIWRFESQGWPRDRLHAVDFPYPLSRDLDDVAQPVRSSSTEQRIFLAAEIEKVLRASGARQLVLMGNSRGGNAIRSYAMTDGTAKISHVILGGTPNHGVLTNPDARLMNEFNGAGPFLTALNNQGAPGVEITPGPKWMTIRSDGNDKFAQPDGVWLGTPGKPTGVTAAGPELKGAVNIVIPGIDHRETSYGPLAFAAAYRHITGREPGGPSVGPEAVVVLDGKVSGQGPANDPTKGGGASNLPLVGAMVEVYATDPATGERRGAALWRKTIGGDGRWGPLITDPSVSLEFVLGAPGYAQLHVFRSPFPRSSTVVNLRAERIADADRAAGSIISFSRPRGYFGLPRDRVVLDGIDPAPGIPAGVAGVATSRIKLAAGPQRAVVAQFNGERIIGRTWPAHENHLVQLELQY